MTLLLSNQEIENLITMDECISALEQAYYALLQGRAGYRPRSDLLMPTKSGSEYVYGFKSMEGAIADQEIVALRLNSDIVHWPADSGVARREKIPALPGRRWLGLVLLFSTRDGRLLAIMPDGVLQRLRVGATSALAAKYLAPAEIRCLGLIGSGWQAGAQLMGMLAVRPIEDVKVYSPNPDHRQVFASEWSGKLDVHISPVSTAEGVVSESDIAVMATSAVEPVMRGSWLRPGMHVSTVKRGEVGGDTLTRCDVLVVHTREKEPEHRVIGDLNLSGLAKAYRPWEREPDGTLVDLLGGRISGRTNASQITCFVNNLGLGLQFAAVGALAYSKAKALGVGKELPDDWFTEDVHP